MSLRILFESRAQRFKMNKFYVIYGRVGFITRMIISSLEYVIILKSSSKGVGFALRSRFESHLFNSSVYCIGNPMIFLFVIIIFN